MSEPSITLTVPGVEPAAPAPQLPKFITGPRQEARRVRWLVGGGMLLIVGLALVRLSLVTGWRPVVRIEGPSMAETYLGAHYQVRCDDCGIQFRCDATNPPRNQRVVCPNCGYRNNALDADQLQTGDRVLIDRWPTLVGPPRRGEVVALRGEPAGELRTKRVVALPGERWGIQNGDLYINDKISRKTFHDLLDQRILVHDNNHQPARSRRLPPRWQGEQSDTRWQAEGSNFVYEPAANESADIGFDWLQYTQWACTGALRDRCESSPVLDNDPYNQGLNRNLNAQSDILLTCSVQCESDGRFAVVAIDEPHRFEIVFDREKRSVVLIDLESEREVARSRERTFADAHRLDVVVALCDQQVFVAEGGQLLIAHPYTRLEPCENLRPLAIGGDQGKLKVANLKVYRDLYYLDPAGTGRPWESPDRLPPGHIAVLGDNAPISLDSRQADAGVPLRQVLGVVYRPFWNASR